MKKALLLIFFLWTFTGCKKTPKTVTKITAKTVEIDASLEEKEAYTALIAPYKSKMISEINTVISYAPKGRTPFLIKKPIKTSIFPCSIMTV